MSEMELICDGCGRWLGAGEDWDISQRGGWLCRPCSESVARAWSQDGLIGQRPSNVRAGRSTWLDGVATDAHRWPSPSSLD